MESTIVVILAPRDEKVTFLGHFYSEATTCITRGRAIVDWKPQGTGRIVLSRWQLARVTRDHSSRGARWLHCCGF